MLTGNYPLAGTLFHCNRISGIDCPGECLYAEGPLKVPLDLQVRTLDITVVTVC